MGKKGDKNTKQSDLIAIETLQRLSGIEGITSKKMFGGHGIFHEGKMFGMVTAKGVLALKGNAETQEKYDAAGAEKFGKMPYYSLPKEVIASDTTFIDWVKEAIRISKP